MKIGSSLIAGARRSIVRIILIISIGSIGSSTLLAQATSYFVSAYGLSGTALKDELERIIDGHTSLSYTPGVWTAHKDLYEDPENSDNLILFYSQDSIPKTHQDNGSSPSDYFNREHLWPKSYGVGTSGSDYTDLFHMVPAYKGVNSDRNNRYFDYTDPTAPGYSDPAHALAPECSQTTDTWEPGDGQKGWAARAILYMTTRYSYLELVDTPPSSAPETDIPRMAQLSVMLEWNRKFLPESKELEVNQRIYDDYQYNRNPYIDFPEFADAVFVSGPSWGAWRLAHFTLDELLNHAISGDNADPDGDGLINLVEMARYSNPWTSESQPPVEMDIVDDILILSIIQAEDLSNLNLSCVLEQSTDMSNWIPVDLSSSCSTSLGDSTKRISIDMTSDTTPYFYRLNVNRP